MFAQELEIRRPTVWPVLMIAGVLLLLFGLLYVGIHRYVDGEFPQIWFQGMLFFAALLWTARLCILAKGEKLEEVKTKHSAFERNVYGGVIALCLVALAAQVIQLMHGDAHGLTIVLVGFISIVSGAIAGIVIIPDRQNRL